MNNSNIITISVVITVLVVVAGYFGIMNMQNSKILDNEHHIDETMEEYEIYPGDVVERIENNSGDIILLDVRTLEEYEESHLKNALLLPVQEISVKSLDSIGLGENTKDKEIIIYCRSGARSKTAYDIMKSLGYTNIKSIQGGMIHWQEDNYPFVESGKYDESVFKSKKQTVSVGSKISFDRVSHNFGTIPQFGGKVETTFIVKNKGTETLEIGEITTSCSCTSASISQTSIKAGGSAILTVIFDPNFHEEPIDVFKRTVFVPTNDPNRPEAEVSIQVDIDEGR